MGSVDSLALVRPTASAGIRKTADGTHNKKHAAGERYNHEQAAFAGPVVNAVISSLPGIGEPAPTARNLEAQRVADNAFDGRPRRNAFSKGWDAESELHEA